MLRAGSGESLAKPDHGPHVQSIQNEVVSEVPEKPKKPQKRSSVSKSAKGILPLVKDDQGRPLFRRPSDGKLVYLHCPVQGCRRKDFPNTLTAMNHISGPRYKHKLVGMITSHEQIMEVCGRLGTDQDAKPDPAPLANDVREPSGQGLQQSAPSKSKTNVRPNADALTDENSALDIPAGPPSALGIGDTSQTHAQKPKGAFDGPLTPASKGNDDEVLNTTTYTTSTSNEGDSDTRQVVSYNHPIKKTHVDNGNNGSGSGEDKVTKESEAVKPHVTPRPSITSSGRKALDLAGNTGSPDERQEVDAQDVVCTKIGNKRAISDTSDDASPPSKRVYVWPQTENGLKACSVLKRFENDRA